MSKKPIHKTKISDDDLAFMSSLSQAALEKTTFKSQFIVWTVLLVFVLSVVWANYTELDKIVRGEGKVVPSSKVQLVQNYEGGIIESILVSAGDQVKRDQVLVQLDNTQFLSTFGETLVEQQALKAKAARLKAEASGKEFVVPTDLNSRYEKEAYEREFDLYQNRMQQLSTSKRIIEQQIVQSNTELKDAFSQKSQLQNSYKLLEKEIRMTEPLVKQGIASEVDLLKTRRELNDTAGKLNAVEHSIPKYQSVIAESEQKIKETEQKFANEAQENLNEVLAKISQMESSKTALEDKVTRTSIRSPVNGTISELLVASIGEVVQPGSDIVKIVPNDDSLVLETKILPSDIGFVYPGLKAKVKFTAYDFAIYGGLDGEVQKISADTITDEEGNSFYIVRIKTQKNHLGSVEDPLYLMAGMTATVDIVVGKHTVLEYLIKPIIKAKDLALRES
ncbi:HlyD family type I secretion periplasmic adaptor subunit [Thiosulfativibrio zosterae]|uniref:Membrane fusion protein (MFP) family protein n=1 Tax=Thiosulfativibrio zosterae TaxID=2675053 RepID=A0A6F8PQ50_9GAMM|nr:HlyD family type I secretion periplasmic adaptor subunit [Thiosulfativibrio zosterae]BBP44251.1 HlyD family type I secretion periplasmic adaptor subunit [Thiosulfativibrio zosterae]